MSKLNDKLLLECIHKGYCTALSMVGKRRFDDEEKGRGNRLLSKKFVWEVSKNIQLGIFSNKDYYLYVVEIDDEGNRIKVDGENKKKPGGWLVDACITEGKKRKEFIRKIVFAMESESGIDKPAFNEDFAKLVHVKASHKLYLNGLNQPNPQKTEAYIEERREYAEQFMNEEDADTFYFGFWPSPGKLDGESAWKQLKKYEHLDEIRLYKFNQKRFSLIGKRRGRLTQK